MALVTTPTYITEAEYNAHVFNPDNATITGGGQMTVPLFTRLSLKAEDIVDGIIRVGKVDWGSESRAFPLACETEISDEVKKAMILLVEDLYKYYLRTDGGNKSNKEALAESWSDSSYSVSYDKNSSNGYVVSQDVTQLLGRYIVGYNFITF